MSFWKSITWQAWKRPIEIPSIYKEYNPSQKSLATLRRKPSPAFPSFNVATMMSTFLSIFFWTCKTTLGRGYGGKGSHCPMLLSEIVALFWSNSKVTYVQAGVSFDQWNGAFCFHLGQSELRVLCHAFHLMLTTWSSSTACNFEKLL